MPDNDDAIPAAGSRRARHLDETSRALADEIEFNRRHGSATDITASIAASVLADAARRQETTDFLAAVVADSEAKKKAADDAEAAKRAAAEAAYLRGDDLAHLPAEVRQVEVLARKRIAVERRTAGVHASQDTNERQQWIDAQL